MNALESLKNCNSPFYQSYGNCWLLLPLYQSLLHKQKEAFQLSWTSVNVSTINFGKWSTLIFSTDPPGYQLVTEWHSQPVYYMKEATINSQLTYISYKFSDSKTLPRVVSFARPPVFILMNSWPVVTVFIVMKVGSIINSILGRVYANCVLQILYCCYYIHILNRTYPFNNWKSSLNITYCTQSINLQTKWQDTNTSPVFYIWVISRILWAKWHFQLICLSWTGYIVASRLQLIDRILAILFLLYWLFCFLLMC